MVHPNDCIVFTWFERDRQNVRLETPNGRVIFDLWDEDVTHAIEDGYLPTLVARVLVMRIGKSAPSPTLGRKDCYD